MKHRAAELLWVVTLVATVLSFLVGVAIAGFAATFGGNTLVGALLVFFSAIGAIVLGLTRKAVSGRWDKRSPRVGLFDGGGEPIGRLSGEHPEAPMEGSPRRSSK